MRADARIGRVKEVDLKAVSWSGGPRRADWSVCSPKGVVIESWFAWLMVTMKFGRIWKTIGEMLGLGVGGFRGFK